MGYCRRLNLFQISFYRLAIRRIEVICNWPGTIRLKMWQTCKILWKMTAKKRGQTWSFPVSQHGWEVEVGWSLASNNNDSQQCMD
ncbi:hypothetical protein L6164_028974 [Bauhinia variegata]|uniref:Uncharacterized protein n=1 Tax=Bauhinia variegata TaxID=167791 RepID=A0ACB9L830_BAUVA|nr:hypothetical protein L6164_028974 [Bauhinia variegata]